MGVQCLVFAQSLNTLPGNRSDSATWEVIRASSCGGGFRVTPATSVCSVFDIYRTARVGVKGNNSMGKHSKRDPEITRRFLLSALVGGATVAGVTVATSGKLYPLDELERVLAQTPPPRELTQAAAAPVAPVTSTVAAPPTTSAAPTTTAAPPTTTRAPRSVVQAPPAADLSEKLAGQSTSGWGLKPLAAAATHLIATTFGILSVGGFRTSSDVAGSDHPKGLAADFMTSNQKLNRDIGNFAIANRALLRVKYVISLQHYNDGSGWTLMENRGSVTANHFDHCHVSFY